MQQVAGLTASGLRSYARLKLADVGAALLHLPLRYQDRSRIWPLASLRPGIEAQVLAVVRRQQKQYRGRRMWQLELEQDGCLLSLRFFHFSAAQQAQITPGCRLLCFGRVSVSTGRLEMVHPEYRRLTVAEKPTLPAFLTPVYPITEGVSQRQIQKIQALVLHYFRSHASQFPDLLQDCLPDYPTLAESLHILHQPPVEYRPERLVAEDNPYRRRLALEELLAHHLALRLRRQKRQQDEAYALQEDGDLSARFLAALPFKRTAAQCRVEQEILKDMAQQQPMLRLLQGDVGAGKTVVAARAILRVLASGYQVALMVPTELLAEQHGHKFCQWLQPLGHRPVLLLGRQGSRQRKEALAALRSGEAQLAIGTHALFQQTVQLPRLALIIIDEQHRFGVQQRLALRNRGSEQGPVPHQLVMTATPIPRSLAMTAYADLALSVLDEMPPGRQPIQTLVVPFERRAEVIARIAENLQQGRQVYWVCTLIEESEQLQCQAAEDSYTELLALLSGQRIGLIHSRIKATERQRMMAEFAAGTIRLLVATTVIEVGIDVPAASLMVIENAERLGLAQLHQLRGRIGRGGQSSHCILLFRAPLPQLARQRLAVLRDSQDGFRIAEQDLALRGPGELLGTRQSGLAQMRIANLVTDRVLLPQVQQLADQMLRDHRQRAAVLVRRWLQQDGDLLNA